MKHTLLRLGRAGACLVLAGALLAGCSVLPAATPRQDAPPAEQALYDSSRLEDGKLRLVYSYSGVGGGTVLHGGKVLYEGSSTDTIQLVTNDLTGETTHYVVSRSVPGTENRFSTLYDADGNVVTEFDHAVSVSLSGSVVLVQDVGNTYSFDDNYTNHTIQLMDTATGETLPVPEDAYSCLIPDEAGQALVFNCYTLPEGVEYAYEDDELPTHQHLLITDRAGNVLMQASGCYAESLYTRDSDLPNWVMLRWQDNDWSTTYQMLYNTATGQMLDGGEGTRISSCGSGVVTVTNPEGGYTLYDLNSDEPVELGQFDADLYLYSPGCIVLNGGEGTTENIPYTLVDTASGERQLVRRVDHDINAGAVAILTADNVLKIYDNTTGALLTDVDTQPIADAAYVFVAALSDGYALVSYDDAEFNTIACQTYGPSGLLWSSEGAEKQYNYMSYLNRKDGVPLLVGFYNAPNHASSYDVLDVQGNLLLKGLGSCYLSGSSWPDDCFFARQGFWYGIMDSSGQWLYRTSIFSSAADDADGNYLY